jgi:hypothetical protein
VEKIRTVYHGTEGEQPGPWEIEPVTSKTRPPAPYKDFTRYRRKYPAITVVCYHEYKVTLVIRFLRDQEPWEKSYLFWLPLSSEQWTNRYAYRWHQTSGVRIVEDVETEWFDASIDPDWDRVHVPATNDRLILPPRDPPKEMLVALTVDRLEPIGGLKPASVETLFAVADMVWVPEAELPKARG